MAYAAIVIAVMAIAFALVPRFIRSIARAIPGGREYKLRFKFGPAMFDLAVGPDPAVGSKDSGGDDPPLTLPPREKT